MPERRDVEADLRQQLGRDARIALRQLRRSSETTVEASIDYLVDRAYRSPDRLLDARDRLGQEDLEARALLLRASRPAADPLPPAPPRPYQPPDGAPGASPRGSYHPCSAVTCGLTRLAAPAEARRAPKSGAPEDEPPCLGRLSGPVLSGLLA